MNRRSFGSVRALTSGRHQARYRGPDGAQYTAPHTFPTVTDANAYLTTVEADIIRETWRAPKRTSETVDSYVARWTAQRPLKESTRANYENLHRLHIAPYLGPTTLTTLTADAVRSWQARLIEDLNCAQIARRAAASGRGRPFSTAVTRDGRVTAAHAYRLLRAAMNTAVEDEVIVRSPCRVKGAGLIQSAERPIASIAEISELAAAVPARYRLVVLLLAYSGLRIGELAAIRRRDIGFDPLSISVHERLYKVRGELDYDRPKSKTSVRTVPLPPALTDAVLQHLLIFVAPAADSWLFTTAGGKPMTGFGQIFQRARVKVGRPDLRVHDLRHTGQTMAALAGATEAEVMHRMGHSTTAASRIYMHSTVEHGQAVAEQLSRMMTDSTVTPLRPVTRRKSG